MNIINMIVTNYKTCRYTNLVLFFPLYYVVIFTVVVTMTSSSLYFVNDTVAVIEICLHRCRCYCKNQYNSDSSIIIII